MEKKTTQEIIKEVNSWPTGKKEAFYQKVKYTMIRDQAIKNVMKREAESKKSTDKSKD